MTKEEAKEKLYMEWQKFLEDNIDYAGISEAYKTAFKALEQEPCEDCISRQAVLDLAKKGVLVSNGNYESVCKAINELPSVNPTKTGHWIDDGFYAEGHSHKAFHCSKCGHNVLGFKEDLSNYCPNCGARMVEPQESEG